MGFSYAINPFTGRQTLCCDFCDGFRGDKKGTKWVRKIPCPYGFCQAWATCNNCKKLGYHEISSTGLPGDPRKENHQLCRIAMRGGKVRKHQIKHIRTSKKGKKFVAGKRNISDLRIKLTHYDSDGKTIATGDLFLNNKRIAWWIEDDMNRIDIFWIGERKAINVNEIDLKEKIRKEWRKQKFRYELFEQPAWSGGKSQNKIENFLERGETGVVAEKNGFKLQKDFDGFHYYWVVRKGNKDYDPSQPWSFKSALSLFNKLIKEKNKL